MAKEKRDIKENNKNKKGVKNKMEILQDEIENKERIEDIIRENKEGWKYYIYKGPSTGVTLKYEEEDHEIVLLSDHKVLLPENHGYTKKMLFNGFLIEI